MFKLLFDSKLIDSELMNICDEMKKTSKEAYKLVENQIKEDAFTYRDIAKNALRITSNFKKMLSSLSYGDVLDLSHLEEKIEDFDKNLKSDLENILHFEKCSKFLIDTSNDCVYVVDESVSGDLLFEDWVKSRYENMEKDGIFISDYNLANTKREVNMREGEIEGLTEELESVVQKHEINYKLLLDETLKLRMLSYVQEEFSTIKEDNLFFHCDLLMLPSLLTKAYNSSIKYTEGRRNFFDDSIDDEVYIPDFKFPKFSEEYSIKGLFPPLFMLSRNIPMYGYEYPWNRSDVEGYIPIDFELNPKDKKVLLVGLHSGGKSFLVENLILTSKLAQIGFPLPTEEQATLPLYNRIYYENGSVRSSRGALESMLSSVGSKIKKVKDEDLIVIDELFGPARPEVISTIGPVIMEKIYDAPGRAIIIDHRISEYKQLKEQGWKIMTPGHKKVKGEFYPTFNMVEGTPRKSVVKQSALKMIEDYF